MTVTRVHLTRLGLLRLQLHQADRAIAELTEMGAQPIDVRCATYADEPTILVANEQPLLAQLDAQPEVHAAGTFQQAASDGSARGSARWNGVVVTWLPEKDRRRG